MNREMLREFIKQQLEEMSATGGGEAFSTPVAFSTKILDPLERPNKKKSKLPGQKNEDINENRYAAYKADPAATSKQKIGRAVSEINRQLNELEKVVMMNARLKSESGLDGSALWKRTGRQLARMEAKLGHIANRLRELKA